MLFNSLQYAAFLPIVVGIAWLLRRRREQNAFLLVASYFFYAVWDWRFLGLLAVSTIVDHQVAIRMGRTDDTRQRRRLLLVSLAVNLGLLGVFKYLGFFVESFQRLLETAGLNADLPLLEVVLPVGISFYTFQTISYTFDVYRRQLDPEPNLLTFALYVSFFPQLVAGPIERAQNLLPRLQRARPVPDVSRVLSGCGLILFGLWKKVAVADAVAPVVARAFDDPATAGWPLLLLGAYAFALQIYGDFSGYTDIARGSARLLGVELMENFRQPYLSGSVTEFWRTWHISLSTWLRDYLYIPLGGNRRGRTTTYRNLTIVMLLGGLWHGAAWTFVIWGAGHGLWLAAERMARDRRPIAREPVPAGLPARVATFHGVALLFVIFRAEGVGEAFDYVGRLLTLQAGTSPLANDVALVGASMLAILVADLLVRIRPRRLLEPGGRPVLQGAIAGAMVVLVAVWSGGTATPFIYFQF